MAKGRVEAKLAMTMAMIEVSGMARIAPAAPQIEDQSASATSTTKGDRSPRCCPSASPSIPVTPG